MTAVNKTGVWFGMWKVDAAARTCAPTLPCLRRAMSVCSCGCDCLRSSDRPVNAAWRRAQGMKVKVLQVVHCRQKEGRTGRCGRQIPTKANDYRDNKRGRVRV
jgi:hypothetical protein